jgi:hypothetical protein
MAYWGVNMNSGGSSVKSCGTICAAASSPRRARILTLELGNASSPADNAFLLIVQRCTSNATGSARTPNMSDAADTLASTIVVTDTVTADPPLTANAFLMNWPVNQRGSVRFVPPPGAEIVIPSTASNGIMVGISAASTTTQGASATALEL